MYLTYLILWCCIYEGADTNTVPDQAFSTIKKDKLHDRLYIGDGNRVKVFDSKFKEVSKPNEIGPPYVKRYNQSDCKDVFRKTCSEESLNNITLLELFYKQDVVYMFVCTDQSNGTCYLIDTNTMDQKPITLNSDVRYLVTHDVKATSFACNLTNTYNDHFYLCMAKDIDETTNYRKRLSIVVLKISLDRHSASVSLISHIAPSAASTYFIRVLNGFVHKSAAYFVIKHYSEILTEKYLLIQLTVTDDDHVHYLETPFRCTGEIQPERFVGVDLVRDELVVFGVKNSTLAVCFTSMARVGGHFRLSREDCQLRNKGVGPEWINERKYNVCSSQAPMDILKSTSVLELEMSPWHHKSPDYPIDSFLVVSRLGSTYAYYTTSIGGDTREIHKMKLGNNSNHLPWKEKVDVGNIIDTWTNGTTLYIVGDKQIVTLDTAGCNYPIVSDCYHDNECTWCGELPGSCTKKHNCSNPGNVNKLGDFEVNSIAPKFGFSCGGSVVRITGRNLDMTTNISVTIGGQNCDVISELSTKTKIEVRVPSRRVYDVINTKTTVVLPNGKGRVEEDFKYMECPKITESPNEINLIGSGGNSIELFVGNIENINITEFHLVEVAFLHKDVVVATVPLNMVKLKDIHTFVFIAPPLNDYINKTLKLGLAAPTYHLLDIPNSRTILYGHLSNLNVNVHKDPVIYGITTGSDTTYIKEYYHDNGYGTIIFTGKDLENIQNDDVSVDIPLLGPCTNVKIDRTRNRLSCNSPWPKKMYLRKLTYPIVIKIGRNLIYHPGEVKFIRGNSKKPIIYDTVTPSRTEIIKITDKPVIPDPQTSIENSNSQVLEIAIPVTVGIVLLLVICCACVCYRFRKYKGRREPVDRELPSIVSYRSNHGVFIGESRPSFQAISAENSSTDAFITENYDDSAQLIISTMDEEGLLLKKRDLNIDMLIGRGNFGSVFKGHLCNKNERMEIAVKTLQRDKPENMDITQFLKEAFVMKNFQHNNVMTLVGVCLDAGDMPLVVLPYMKHGDLLAYLQEETHIPTVKDLVCFGLGIAQGMEYLASLKFVHRDLAARNCMLDVNYKVKVADFGLSRDVYEASYYSTQSKGIKLPVKWMSIESLSGGVFNEKTDVWSFGITLWELMTRGVRPYAAVDNWDMEAYLKSGRRLPQPMYCPANLYKLMRKCWSQEPEDRPSFTIVKDWISELLNRVHHHLGDMESTTNIGNTYVNLGKGNQCIYENLANF